MKKGKISTFLSLVLVIVLGAASAVAATKTSKIRVEGMHCNKCAQSIAKALKATPGVEQVDVSYENREAIVQFDDQKVTEAELRAVINKTGFKAVEGVEE
jgi:copper chaperone CopZ